MVSRPATNPEKLAQATLYLPTRRAGRMAREIFLDELKTDAVLLPRIVALGDIDEDELAFAQAASETGLSALETPPAMEGLQRRLLLAQLIARMGQADQARRSVAGAARGRRSGLDAGAGRRSGAADGRHGDPRRRMARARRAGAGCARPILAADAAIPPHRQGDVAGTFSTPTAGSSRRRGAIS